MKLEYLRSRHGARIARLATATPIANSITEAHVMSRYLRLELQPAPKITAAPRTAARRYEARSLIG